MTNLVINVPGEYVSLGLVLQSALEQASKGKGKERHASEGEAYEDQIICEVARRVGLGYPLGQAVKKIYESQRIGGERGVAELLGALNYVAAAIIVMREGLEPAPKAEGGCFQNGNDHSPEASAEPDFKPGDKVQFCQFPHADVWLDGIVERVEECHCFIRRSNGVEVSAPKRLIRRPCAESCEKPKFKAGDKVQIRVTLPSVSDRIWVDGTYARYDRGCAFPHAVYNDAGHEENVQEEDIRPAPKADEEPEFRRGDRVEVQMVPDSSTWASAVITAVYRDKDSCEWRYCVDFEDGWAHVVVPSARVRPASMPKAEDCEEPAYNPDNDAVGGVITLAWPRGKVLEKLYASGRIEKCAEGCEALVEKDAPQTKEELMQRIVDCNPSVYPRTPTGEELAEMAEEVTHG